MHPTILKAYAQKLSAEYGHEVSITRAEHEVTQTVMEVARNLALSPAYSFGYHSREDIEQQGTLEALKVLAKGPEDPGARYDPARPLENFLYVHVKRRLLNFKRDHYMRSEAPCECCDAFNPGENPCRRWQEWSKRNAAKRNLMRPQDVSILPDESVQHEVNVVDHATFRETERRIDEQLDPELRSDYLRMRAGVPVPKSRRLRVREALKEILADGD